MTIQRHSCLLNPKDIEAIFSDGRLYELNSFFVIDPNTLTYDTSPLTASFLEQAKNLRQKFLEGHTIIVKNLENFTEAIRLKASSLGREVDVHMYLVPPNGKDSFPFHEDDRDVLVNLIYGEKIFRVKTEGHELKYHLKPGLELFLPKGTIHRAEPLGGSCLLSFGINTNLTYSVAGGIQASDLGTSREVV